LRTKSAGSLDTIGLDARINDSFISPALVRYLKSDIMPPPAKIEMIDISRFFEYLR